MLIGYINYFTLLLIGTGVLILFFDVKGYQLLKMTREEKAARIIGWINVACGAAAFVGNWIYLRWFW